ncbi:hypothetical protein [Streptomyces sp. NBC_00328]|nr:hypothetical protein [Streptomyces sp. NBC_00328]
MPNSDDHARTSARLTTYGCLAGLALALIAVFGFPLWIFLAFQFGSR